MTIRVAALTRSAMKGTQREQLERVRVDPEGLAGDREFLLVKGTQALTTVANPRLLRWDSRWDGRVLTVDTGGGPARQPWSASGAGRTVRLWGRPLTVEVADGAVARAASEALGSPVEVARVRGGGRAIYDDPVSVLFCSELATLLPEHRDPRPFRMNILVDDRGEPVGAHPGLVLRFGEAVVRLRRPMVRCRVLDHAAGRSLLAHVPRTDAGPVLGWGAAVETPGIARVGDRLR